ncbi:hypothetical protein AXI59_16060 [Bacillus nakamurai]|nr:hypothetical protein [Bacillus nakamurai]KXZ18776.1 hypothetical protein AXI59_16060 [Bacillus nakamurai]
MSYSFSPYFTYNKPTTADATGDHVKKIVRRVKFVDYGRFGLSAYSLKMKVRNLGLLNRLKKKS